jgi:thiol-disulfide isomerase/thioredoxin
MHKNTFLLLLLVLCFVACGSPKPAPRPTPKPTPKPAPVVVAPPQPASDRPELPIQSDASNILWVASDRLMPVLEEAQRINKNVFVTFEASWCAPCKVMESEIFTQPQVYELYNRKFINFKTDFDSSSGKVLAQIYEVEKLPTVLLLDPKGVVLERYTGMATVAKMKEIGEKH